MEKNQNKKYRRRLSASAIGPALGAGIVTTQLTSSWGDISLLLSMVAAVLMYILANGVVSPKQAVEEDAKVDRSL